MIGSIWRSPFPTIACVRSWRLPITMHAAFCVGTLEDALAHHGKPDIFNTDRGGLRRALDQASLPVLCV
jgi:hypothetical protein